MLWAGSTRTRSVKNWARFERYNNKLDHPSSLSRQNRAILAYRVREDAIDLCNQIRIQRRCSCSAQIIYQESTWVISEMGSTGPIRVIHSSRLWKCVPSLRKLFTNRRERKGHYHTKLSFTLFPGNRLLLCLNKRCPLKKKQSCWLGIGQRLVDLVGVTLIIHPILLSLFFFLPV